MNVYSELVSAQLENKTSDYAAGIKGRTWMRTDTKLIKVDNGDAVDTVLTDLTRPERYSLVASNTGALLSYSGDYPQNIQLDFEQSKEVVRRQQILYLDPAEYSAGLNRTIKLRLKATLLCNDTAPASTLTVGLYPVTRPGTTGATNFYQFITLGTVVTGSEITFTTPAADSMNHSLGTDFDFPAAGYYAFGVQMSAAIANNARVDITADLQIRSV